VRQPRKTLAAILGNRFVVFALAGVVLASGSAHPQSTAAPKPAFSVVSVKPSPAATRQHLAIEPGGRFVAEGVQFNLLVALAYHLQAYQLSGLEPWMNTDPWTIDAKSDDVAEIPAWVPPLIPDVIAVRLQSLLEDRFALKVHFEPREMQTYALTVDKSSPKLQRVDSPAAPPFGGSTGGQPAPKRGAPSANPIPPPGATLAGAGKIIASAITMNQFVTLLNRLMDRPVIDHTNLTGYYNISLQFDPASTPRFLGPPPAPGAADGSAAALPASDDPSIFVALEQQLGLKLEPGKEPVQILVVDSAERPTPNEQ
jgi:uncharacterized protein (TIGR03435 family)